MESTPLYAAVVLAGGKGARLGGVDKADIDVGNETLLRRALVAVTSASATVVVGPSRALAAGVLMTREDPPGGGPVAAIAAGLAMLTADDSAATVVVLACDMPLVDQPDIQRLVLELTAHSEVDAAMYVDADERRQYLAAAYRRGPLEAAIAAQGDPSGGSMRAVVARLTVAEIAAHPDLTLDCDTWPDVERTRRILEDR